jgi:uncharacterized OsmC-like protein
MNKSETDFIQFKRKRELKLMLKVAQDVFDKQLKKTTRDHYRNKINRLDEINTSNPKEFWDTIKQLGPRKNKDIPMKVKIDENQYETRPNEVLTKWKNDFYALYNPETNALNHFDNAFYEDALSYKHHLERETMSVNYMQNDYINRAIDFGEIAAAAEKLKNRKSTGADDIPNEVLKNNDIIHILLKLFQYCFENAMLPYIWTKSIIKPIPRGSQSDPYVPMHYRGISLLSCVSKLYTSILNKRIKDYCELVEIYVEEQNGFRTGRSCTEHIFTLNSVVKGRMSENQATYAAFLDMEKAFDRVDRQLMMLRLLQYNIDGKMNQAVNTLYKNTVIS